MLPAAVSVVFACLAVQAAPTPIALEIRVFRAGVELTAETRVTVHGAGNRADPVGVIAAHETQLIVPPGIYDAQAVHERDGRVQNIRWAERLVVMPYPDERGQHLEVINFATGYGALQVRGADGGPPPDVTLYASGDRSRPAAVASSGAGYLLFVVPAGVYDIQVRTDGESALHSGIEVPLDRTRLWLVP